MDVMRRFGAGELSEILGEDTLKIDREKRILGLRAAARNRCGWRVRATVLILTRTRAG